MHQLNAAKTFESLDSVPHTGSTQGYDFVGWDYKGGWLIASPQLERFSGEAIWTDDGSQFFAVPRSLAGQQTIEVGGKPLELTSGERGVLGRIAWQLEFGDAMAKNGMCVVQSLARALDLTVGDVTEMFIRGFRDPQRLDHLTETLQENGYGSTEVGPDGFGCHRERRRLVLMERTDGSKTGHVVLVYENDEGIFDSSGFFKQVGDLLLAPTLGYRLTNVLLIEKVAAS
jgi:hypothetical protein